MLPFAAAVLLKQAFLACYVPRLRVAQQDTFQFMLRGSNAWATLSFLAQTGRELTEALERAIALAVSLAIYLALYLPALRSLALPLCVE